MKRNTNKDNEERAKTEKKANKNARKKKKRTARNKATDVRIYRGYEIDHYMFKAKTQVQKENTPKDMERTSNQKIRSYKLKDLEARAKYQKELEKSMDKALTEGILDWEKYKETIREVAKKIQTLQGLSSKTVYDETKLSDMTIPESIAYSKNSMCIIPFEKEHEVEVNFQK
ncbi:hypothetical protein ILUMI_19656 [Ignelater luminosus]|uniref:Uncharacterized protein n=1 Tax=Ignelater luminosus TaxID=2038154 RepID=A0A8K0CJQ5_IGNLU|nr:hypothetical protein ILUMI_19656 [Ignelater luminosus]